MTFRKPLSTIAIIMMNASEARKRATSFANATNAVLLAEIEQKIEQAVNAGDTAVNVAYLSNPHVRKALEDNGYKVKNFTDPRGGESWCTISW